MNTVSIERLTARNGQQTLRANLLNGRSIYLHSAYDPEREARGWLPKIPYQPGKTVILFGLGLGHHLRVLISKIGPEGRVFVIEPSDEIRRLAESTPEVSALLNLPSVDVCKDWSSFRQAFLRTESPWQDTQFLKIPSYQQAFREEYVNFVSKLHHQVNSVLVDLCTVMTSSRKWQENCLRNLRYLPESSPIASVFNRFKEMPVIIVSAGPSLSKNIDTLASAKGKALILAVGTVNRLLAEKNILPDLLLSFDGGQPNYDHHFKNVRNPKVCLAFDPAVHHLVVRDHSGPKSLMLINPGNEWLEEHSGKEIGFLKTGPSISNTAFDLACRLGADPIILVGQDLAYTNGVTHAEGTHVKGLRGFRYELSEPESEENLRRFIWVDGLDGTKVRTDSRMLTFLHWFEERIDDLGIKTTVIDATEGGALIRGTLPLTLAETLDRFCQKDLTPSIQRIKQLLSRKPDYDIASVAAYLRRVRLTSKRLAGACKKGARLSKALKEYHTEGKNCDVEGTLKRLHRIDRLLVREESNYLPLHYLTGPILGLLSRSVCKTESQADVSHYSYLLYLELYRAFSSAVPLLEELIDSLDGENGCRSTEIGLQPSTAAQISQL